jgi:hypothetical protein
LGRHLQGKVLEAFESMRDVNDSYYALRNKLLKWYEDMKDLRKEKNRSTFRNAKYTRGESFYLFSSRLEKLYHVSYPNHKVSISKVLREKFVASLPKSVRSEFVAEVRSYKLRDKTMTWKIIQKMARLRDIESEKQDDKEHVRKESDAEIDEDKKIIINVGQEKLEAAKKQMERQPITTYQGRVYQAQSFAPKQDNRNRNEHEGVENNQAQYTGYMQHNREQGFQ